MPNYYAHLLFGSAVLERLSPGLRAEVEADLPPFQAGLFGPDPLFFYHLARPGNYPRQKGLALHKVPVRPTAERLREMAGASLPHGKAYAAGFLCHFALDAAAHPEVNRLAEALGLTHTGIEAELDRALMLSQGVDPLRETPLPPLGLPEDFFPTAAAVYGVSREEFRKALDSFRRFCRLQTRAAGTALAPLAARMGRRFPALASARGLFLPKEPDPAYGCPAAVLRTALEREAAPTAAELEGFFTPGTPLGPWYDRTFDGT